MSGAEHRIGGVRSKKPSEGSRWHGGRRKDCGPDPTSPPTAPERSFAERGIDEPDDRVRDCGNIGLGRHDRSEVFKHVVRKILIGTRLPLCSPCLICGRCFARGSCRVSGAVEEHSSSKSLTVLRPATRPVGYPPSGVKVRPSERRYKPYLVILLVRYRPDNFPADLLFVI
jgi:hypothetical protein